MCILGNIVVPTEENLQDTPPPRYCETFQRLAVSQCLAKVYIAEYHPQP